MLFCCLQPVILATMLPFVPFGEMQGPHHASHGPNPCEVSTPKVFGVIIGIADYEGTENDLTYADQDAYEFYRHLTQAMPTEVREGDLRLIQNSDATHSNVMATMKQVFAKSGPDDFLVFYFSGHGNSGYFCPHDLHDHALDHDHIKEVFRNASGRYRLVIADACFSGSISGNPQPHEMSESALRDNRLAVIMSSRTDQYSQENWWLQNGVFTYHMIEGLKGEADSNSDNYITAEELFMYTKDKVVESSNATQIPVIFGLNLDRIPLTRLKH